jgi:hypothetical protein
MHAWLADAFVSDAALERTIAMAQRDNLTVCQLAQRLGGYGGLAMVGTPATIADEMEEWLTSDARANGSSPCSRTCPAASTTLSTRCCLNCGDGGFPARVRGRDAARELQPAQTAEHAQGHSAAHSAN